MPKYLLLFVSFLLVATNAYSKTRYLAEPGLYVANIAAREYFSSSFSKVIEKHNRLKSGALKPGQEIMTPKLDAMLIDNGFQEDLRGTAYKIVRSLDLFNAAAVMMTKDRAQKPRARSKLNLALGNLRQSKNILINKTKPTVPYVMISKLDNVIKGIDSFMRKKSVPTRAQIKWVYNEFAEVFSAGIDWSRSRRKYYEGIPMAH
jgi:hypothetical protein